MLSKSLRDRDLLRDRRRLIALGASVTVTESSGAACGGE